MRLRRVTYLLGAMLLVLFVSIPVYAFFPSSGGGVKAKGKSITLSDNGTFTRQDIGPTLERTFHIDPGGTNRNYNPSGSFADWTIITIENTADAAETITFDSAGIAVQISQGNSSSFQYNGSAWVEISRGSGLKWSKGFKYNAMVATDDFLVWRNNTGTTITIARIDGILESGTNIIGMFYICNSTTDITDPMDIPGNCDACDSSNTTFDGGWDSDTSLDGVVELLDGYSLAWVTDSVNAPGFFYAYASE